MYTVKEVSKMLDLSEHTVRFYTDKGLVPSLKRDKNNNRLFDDESINWLTGVKYLRDCGMPLESVKKYVDLCLEGDSTIEMRYQIILEQKAKAQAQLEEAQKRLAYMEKKAEMYRETLEQHVPDRLNPAKWPRQSAG
ncbi:MerR family transcriptional regulator [Anaerovorax odorimutans]|uniref:MerR family transcriptional regulator n=1 Tax=Anaerovorax odorimutans TaxID=109327 RepID=A0ABT1RQX0_9FIRM|nr:MerR family transcriptional regulator [Anaerovorax odorimutans]MCQ4637596.1 MerR family transcriptional regulator [Anaerovorax odorimutans]